MTADRSTSVDTPAPDSLERYSRQVRFAGIGAEGQQRICQSRILLCGCGALGTVLADTLVRAGVGFVRIVDRDFVDLSNLQRQVLFDEQDVAEHLPKSVVAAKKLARVNSQVTIEPHVADIDWRNIREFAKDVDLIVDGTDNFEIRFLINDVSLETGIPWVYAGCVGSHGQTMAIFPHESACLRCVIEVPPDAGSIETCDSAGVIAPAIHMVTALQAATVLKILAGRKDLVPPQLSIVDVWDGSLRQMNLANLRDKSQCPACVQGRRDWLNGGNASQSVVLCGRNSVQISPAFPAVIALEELERKLESSGTVTRNPFLVRLTLNNPSYELTIFRDGRAIIQGTDDINVARGLYARFIG
ncbi:ThiF family adenylyltransferase [Schlesneria sp. DSM 10557]|uniref:ThiF family adenylyltransferase n=1 Tax=Schlesneria sp. DSM 10557 TaxID=3044399 RepID=UPI00359F53BB